jgi:hypothetical protein
MADVEQKELAVLGLGEQFRRGQTSHALPARFSKEA